MATTPIEIAQEFFALWSADRMEDALAMLSDDVFYDNVPFPDIIGRDGVRQFHLDFGFGKDWRAEFRVVNIAAAGNVVLSERVDVFFHTSGGTITLPVMGTVTIKDGMITVWRDYFDPTDFNQEVRVRSCNHTCDFTSTLPPQTALDADSPSHSGCPDVVQSPPSDTHTRDMLAQWLAVSRL
jgi:limonene-1,2-epoxide hydrolase